MHVAIAVLFALWLQTYRKLAVTTAGWCYAAVIYLGSIHLGWHYASDGIISGLFVVGVWWGLGRFIYRPTHVEGDRKFTAG